MAPRLPKSESKPEDQTPGGDEDVVLEGDGSARMAELERRLAEANARIDRLLGSQSQEAPRAGVTAPAAPAKPGRVLPEGPIRVRAVSLGFYPEPGEVRARARQPGEEFTISHADHLAHKDDHVFGWMELVDEEQKPKPKVPVTTAPNAVLQDPMGIPAGGLAKQIPS